MSFPFRNPAIATLPEVRTGSISSQDVAKINERARKRSERARQRTERREKLKTEGNGLFKQERYSEAIEKYEQALRVGGTKQKPILLSNLAAAYLKLTLYEQAEEAATEALVYDPTNVKARYRRGLARKGVRRAIGASIDFEAVIQQEPRNTEVASELKNVKQTVQDGRNSPSDDEYTDQEYTWPRCLPYEANEDGADSDSGSSDCEHVGNGVGCRFYNHGGCTRGSRCQFSHAPDDKSVRDKLGRNVCIFAILGSCEYGEEKCIYSHDLRHLPEKGWWRDQEHRREMQQYIYMARDLKEPKNQAYIVEMIHGYLYDSGFGVPRNLESVLDRGILGHTIHNQSSPNAAANPPLDAPQEQFILVISIDNAELLFGACGNMLAGLNAKLKTEIASTADTAHALLLSPNLAGVLVAHPSITQTRYDAKVSIPLAEYTKHGGLVVFGGVFPSYVQFPALASYFKRVWNLPWESGSSVSEMKAEEKHETVVSNRSLPASFVSKSISLRNVSREGTMYSDQYDEAESAIVHVKHGNGYLGYIGDVSGSEESTTVMLSMFGLLDHAYPPPPTPFKPSSIPKPSVKPPATFSRRFIMLVSLQNEDWFHEMYGHVFSALREKVQIKQALTSDTAFSYLASPDLVGVLITDYGVADANHATLLRKLVDYAKAGGLVVAGANFSNHMTGARAFFQPWGFQWQKGSYHRTTFQKNSAAGIVESNPSLPQTYNAKALHLTGLAQANAVYLPAPDAQVQSLVFPATSVRNFEESPVVHAKVGKGYLGYIGDVNAEKDTTSILFAMLGLLDHKYDSSDSSRDGGKRSKGGKSTTAGASGAVRSRASGNATVLVISMTEIPDIYKDEHEHLLKNLDQATHFSHASTANSAVESLSSPGLVGVLVNEPTIVVNTKYAELLGKLITYVKGGGVVVFGGSFSSLAGARVLDEFWEQKWGIKWTFGSYQRSLLTAESEHPLLERFSQLVKSYDTKAVHLTYQDSREAVYRDEELVNQGAILRARVGEGFVGYVGDVYGEAESTDIILAMLGQLKQL
ncbi:hypothetical protein V5O48_006592 [Marasmius crinis-equi]|uniref:C3H1-type domain-containing protein n=1 Tax=Marasmius crinis-equi TaxID=585013 RepID=A0ABR3FJ36_9AGAR